MQGQSNKETDLRQGLLHWNYDDQNTKGESGRDRIKTDCKSTRVLRPYCNMVSYKIGEQMTRDRARY